MNVRAVVFVAIVSGAGTACSWTNPAVCDRTLTIPSQQLPATDLVSAIADDRAIEAIGCGGLSWIRTRSGELGTVDQLGHVGRMPVSSVKDVHRSSHGELLILRGRSGDNESSSSVTVARYDGTGFIDLPAITLADDEVPLGIVDDDGVPVVITDARLLVLQETRSIRRLNPPLGEEVRRGGAMAAVPTRGGTVYVGLNRGEFGGGVQAIEMSSGRVSQVRLESTASDGTTRSEAVADTVTAMVADPSAGDCVVVSAGLEHLGGSWGRVSRICAASMRVVLQREIGPWTMPFYGLAADDSGVWAVSTDHVFRIGLPGPVQEPLRLQPNANGIYRLSPDVIVICRDGCERPLIANLH
jgi:hypothetical protein